MICTLREFLKSVQPENTFRLFQYTDEVYKEKKCYSPVALKKKNGGLRVLQVPNERLKRLQRQMLPYLQDAEISPCAAAYIKGRNLLDHAGFHTNSRVLVKLDIEDFFGSVSFQQVFHAVDEALKRSPLAENNREITWFVSKVCTLNGSLPQGAPTSPILSNMVFLSLDQRISSYCIKRGIRYTRYSDDMFFSGDFQVQSLIAFIRKLLGQKEYVLNEKKIAVAGSGRQQKVTGVVVNERPQTDRKYRREIRQSIYYIGKYGLEEHLRMNGIISEDKDKLQVMVNELQKLIGRIVFVLQIDPRNNEFQEYKKISIELLNRVPIIWNS